MAAYPRPVNLRSTIINFHYVTIVFLPNLENIYTGKNVSSRTMNNFYVTLSCSLARVPSPFVADVTDGNWTIHIPVDSPSDSVFL